MLDNWIFEATAWVETSYPNNNLETTLPLQGRDAVAKCHEEMMHSQAPEEWNAAKWMRCHWMYWVSWHWKWSLWNQKSHGQKLRFPQKQQRVSGGWGNFKRSHMNVTLIQNVLGRTYIYWSPYKHYWTSTVNVQGDIHVSQVYKLIYK